MFIVSMMHGEPCITNLCGAYKIVGYKVVHKITH